MEGTDVAMRFLTLEWALSDNGSSDDRLQDYHKHLAGIDWSRYRDAEKLITGLDLRGAKITGMDSGSNLMLELNPLGANQTSLQIHYTGFRYSLDPSPIGKTIWYDEVRQEAHNLCHAFLFTDRSEIGIQFDTLEIAKI